MVYSKYHIIKMFLQYILLFLNQASSCSDPSQILILQFPIPGASLPPSPSLSNFTLANWKPSSTQYLSCSSSVSLFCPTPFDHALTRYWIYQTMCQAKPIKCIIKLYTDHNILWVKHTSHEKAESLRETSLSKLDNTVNSNSIFNTKYAGFSAK